MNLGESIFDIMYLTVIIGLGIRLIFENTKKSKMFGIMAITLGVGDAFHLIPRVVAQLSPNGFEVFNSALSWGKFVTGITMTIFYLMFYFYYRSITSDRNETKKWLIIILTISRIALILLPQNNWGAEENYKMSVLRNIPFVIMGALLIIWTYKNRKVKGLEHMSLLIFLSFLFYIPVVLWSEQIPTIGLLMIPKTLAYVGIIVLGFRQCIPRFGIKNIYDTSICYLIMGLVAGVFYREFTKFFDFTAESHLSKLHVHTIVLGCLVLLMLYILVNKIDKNISKNIEKSFHIYNIGLVITLVSMTVYGIFDVVGDGKNIININAISGISGIGHIILAIGIIMIFMRVRNEMILENTDHHYKISTTDNR